MKWLFSSKPRPVKSGSLDSREPFQHVWMFNSEVFRPKQGWLCQSPCFSSVFRALRSLKTSLRRVLPSQKLERQSLQRPGAGS